MVLQLATVLEIPLKQQNLMLTAAGFTPIHAETDLSAPEMALVRKAIFRKQSAAERLSRNDAVVLTCNFILTLPLLLFLYQGMSFLQSYWTYLITHFILRTVTTTVLFYSFQLLGICNCHP